MQTLASIKRLLEEHGLAPKKSLGQNFLIDQNLVRKLSDAALVGPGASVLEVGPGTGVLTDELARRVAGSDDSGRVIACELDDALARLLAERANDPPLRGVVRVVHADCLGPDRGLSPALAAVLALERFTPDGPFSLVANLPYGCATPLICSLLLSYPCCTRLAVTVQKEVADRLLASPSTKDYGAVSVIAQALCTTSRIATLPPECFWPRPEVTSSMVLLTRRATPLTADPCALSDFCRIIFAQRRKQLGALLRAKDIHPVWPNGIVPSARAGELSIEQIELLRLACLPPPP